MEIIPAIDIRAGKCVRLSQGREDAETVYDADPVAVAARWTAEGATRIHVVNLDGAFGRESQATDILKSIAASTPARVQFGGGLRTRDSVRAAFEAGAERVVLGTVAFEQRVLLAELLREFGTERIVVALDARDGVVATRGWKELTGVHVDVAADELRRTGVAQILYTDIGRDGMMSGPDIETLGRLSQKGLAVIASGGIASLQDLVNVIALGPKAIAGAIIGKALYERKVSLGAAIALAALRPGGEAPHHGKGGA
ncbi:MAG TPA: 1-(5-phosphoribosyl)-5-[(5-phosphoribosylamino)methylideneamino]imidazole-4-carboxamide isomerase [Bacteroidota bacterium]|nr:1-(5-phosphoribosyl)-5-[(5-phosphoribosylamino)methylideneamino]imidazole-4-carboxamide isomerase [Bacteroidota bacterium]